MIVHPANEAGIAFLQLAIDSQITPIHVTKWCVGFLG